jgi:hypothetical protein
MDKSQKHLPAARLFVVAVLAVAGWFMVNKTGVANTDEAGIVLALPERVGPWQGHDLVNCPDEACARVFVDVPPGTPCPACGKPLQYMNHAEKRMLPADTGLVRKYYERDGTQPVNVNVVLSGDDRSSIHRPQVCMTANGYEIVNDTLLRIPLGEGREPLDVMVLDMDRTGADGRVETIYYAYWFVGKGRETASHVRRMVWMATDRVLRGVSHRWAYIAFSAPRDPQTDAHLQQIANFAAALHPLLLVPEDGPGATADAPTPTERE